MAGSTVTVTGLGSGSSRWVVTHGGSSWLTLVTTTGTGNGAVQWQVDPTGLSAGFFLDTVAVTVAGAIGSPLRFIDSLWVYEPAVVIACAENVLLASATCLGAVERNFLDMTGNRDGAYNLGDLLAYLDRKGVPLTPPLLAAAASRGIDREPRRPQ